MVKTETSHTKEYNWIERTQLLVAHFFKIVEQGERNRLDHDKVQLS